MKNSLQGARNTPAFRWTEMYSVNVVTLDRQHQGLFDTINELNAALAVGRGAEAMEGVLRKLIHYAKIHFAAEEALMREHGFPGLTRHRAEHAAFAQKVAGYLEDFQISEIGPPVSLLLFLQSWLKKHILQSDKAYSDFLTQHGVR